MTDDFQTNFDNTNELQLGLCINDQYVTIKKIGVGGFGIVWLAYDFSLRNFVAIKEVYPEYSQPKFVEMFYKEALIAKNIIHDNIVRVQHFWQGSNGSFYIVLDYVRGIDLEELIRKCNDISVKIPWKLSTVICMDVLKAIDYANRIARDSISGKAYGIVYRDISPGNVLLSFDGNIKLSDFGIAKTADEIKDSIPEKVITGKYPYMSPEQIQGLPNIDNRTDIYSVAVLYYEMLTGKQLYRGTNQEIKEQVLNKKFDPKDLDPTLDIPDEIGSIIAKALEKNREDRYEKAVEVNRDLRRVLKEIDTEELLSELSNFINSVMRESVVKSEKFIEKVKTLDIHEIQQNPSIQKIICQDFIVGQVNTFSKPPIIPTIKKQELTVPLQENITEKETVSNQPSQQVQQRINRPGEEKGKTVFEEVGDWLFIKLNDVRKSFVRVFIAVVLAAVIFCALDIFVLQLTSLGKNIHSKLYPPDIIVTTIPAGAVVSMVSKDGSDVILNNVSSSSPISVKKVAPKAYVVTALKEGFKPVKRIVQIEKSENNKKVKKEKIEILFDFVLNIDSEPRGADVFIDGNKFGNTPCKAQLFAGAHTIKLSLANFEDLGANSAGNIDQGKCNIDFSKSTVEEMFSGVDRKYWNCELKNIDGETVFCVKGSMFKKMNIDSEPQGMLVHVQGEEQSRGKTPLKTAFKVGNHKIRLMDPNAKYGETLKEIEVNKDSNNTAFIKMDKLVSFRMISKDNPNDNFVSSVSISNKKFNIKKSISSSKPITIPLPIDTYDITFEGDDKYGSYVISNVNIKDTNLVIGKMEYTETSLNLNIVSQNNNKNIERAFVWLNKKNLGRSDSKGNFNCKLKPGKYELRIIAKNYEQKIVTVNLSANKNNNINIEMVLEMKTKQKGNAVNNDVKEIKKNNTKNTKKDIQKSKKKDNKKLERKDTADISKKENKTAENQVIVCLNCGYVNTAPAGKKLRFCVNCAKPLK